MSATSAQHLANVANVYNTNATNYTNQLIAEHANEWNWANAKAQNEWNIQQWNRENEYNSPSAQMQRYLEAGINPLWAMSKGDAGNAQQLTSASVAPASVPTMVAPQVAPEYDPYAAQHIGNIVTAARDVVNGIEGFGKLYLENRSLDIQEKKQMSSSALDYASAFERRATGEARNLENQWSLATLDNRIHQEAKKLDLLYSEIDKLGADTAESRAKKLQAEENTKYITEQINATIAGVRQRDYELSIAARNAATNARNAATGERNVSVQEGRLKLEDEKFSAEIKQWNNENLMKFLGQFTTKHTNDAYMGAKVLGIGGSYEGHDERYDFPELSRFKSAGLQVLQRAADNPSPQNLHDAEKAASVIREVDLELFRRMRDSYTPSESIPNFSNQSVINPSEPWQ